MAQLPLIRQNQAANAHIDAATPSYLPTSINQPNQNMPHRSELSQGRRQNHQERHQSCPKTGGKTTGKDIRVFPRQEAKPPGKTSELSFLGHRWRNCLLSWDKFDRCEIFHLGSPRKTDPTKCQVSFGKLRKKFFFGGLGGVRFPGPSKVANCQSVDDCKNRSFSGT